MPGRVVVELCRQRGHHLPHIPHQDAGEARRRIGRLADVGNGPPTGGAGQIFRLEMGPLTEKQRAGDCLPGVVGHQLHRAAQIQPLRHRGRQLAQTVQQGAVVRQGEYIQTHTIDLRKSMRSPLPGGGTSAFNPAEGG